MFSEAELELIAELVAKFLDKEADYSADVRHANSISDKIDSELYD